ncbi:hypothetical protein [Chamaesiphon sp.]|uniref:hypothetical protein n=1 Tax=Chamaesiphon sp. TaxID=2814140 RepID=UPI0035936469
MNSERVHCYLQENQNEIRHSRKKQAVEALRKRSEFENGLAIEAYEDEKFVNWHYWLQFVD